ncbi:amidohydrolase family protein [uncultured Sphingomonas sp.]|uniref:N-acyl-D-amino-acid deacylase family protein n=1 Tax=uncultured Sphingomonas sp. TaxID=158754 RepID=UPI0035C9BE09
MAAILWVTPASIAARPVADLIIRGGTIYRGSDAPFVGDVEIVGDRIVAIGPRLNDPAKRIIDARGMIVAPGFIDPHTHMGTDLASDVPRDRLVAAFLLQGVTTAFIGNDGGGDPDLARVLGSVKDKPVGINFAAYAGFGAIREQVIGEADRAPTASELARMRALVAGAMCQGALGLSTGLFYAPQSFAKTDEVVALAREAAIRGGVYDSHIRDESNYTVGLAAAIDEAIRIGREAAIPVHISHIKALGVDVQGQAPTIVAKIEAARRAGEAVTADQYPWLASGTSLVASLVPPWAQDGGRAALIARFDDPATLARIKPEMTENLRRRGGAERLLLPDRDRTLGEIALQYRGDPVTVAIALIRAGDPAVISFNQGEADIATFMTQPWVMTGSDASPGHPRVFGTFARKYAVYVREKHLITLRQFIERSTALTADTFGLGDRGRLRVGGYADVVVFDPDLYAARATYRQPTLPAVGVRTVVVNGQLAVDNGALTNRAAGRALPHKPMPGTCP